jgi:hypothetical protein
MSPQYLLSKTIDIGSTSKVVQFKLEMFWEFFFVAPENPTYPSIHETVFMSRPIVIEELW